MTWEVCAPTPFGVEVLGAFEDRREAADFREREQRITKLRLFTREVATTL